MARVKQLKHLVKVQEWSQLQFGGLLHESPTVTIHYQSLRYVVDINLF